MSPFAPRKMRLLFRQLSCHICSVVGIGSWDNSISPSFNPLANQIHGIDQSSPRQGAGDYQLVDLVRSAVVKRVDPEVQFSRLCRWLYLDHTNAAAMQWRNGGKNRVPVAARCRVGKTRAKPGTFPVISVLGMLAKFLPVFSPQGFSPRVLGRVREEVPIEIIIHFSIRGWAVRRGAGPGACGCAPGSRPAIPGPVRGPFP